MRRRAVLKRLGLSLFACAALLPRPGRAQSDVLVDIRDLIPREYRTQVFVLSAPQTIQIEAVGAEPAYRTGRERRNGNWYGDDFEKNTWPAAAWIIDAHTREVVWDLRTSNAPRTDDGLRRFRGTVRLPAGTYVARYGFYAGNVMITNGTVENLASLLRAITRRQGRGVGGSVRFSGPYVDDGSYRQFQLLVSGTGRRGTDREAVAARGEDAAQIAALRPDTSGATLRYGFELDRATPVEIVAEGELRPDGAFDYGWILNADTRRRVWTMNFDRSEPAGGAAKNRAERDTITLPAGHYVAYYVTDDSHDPDDWNAVPPLDPDAWGMTLRVTDAAARARVRAFNYEPVPAGQTIVSMTGIRDDELRSEGFTLRQPLEVRIYAIGEGISADEEEMDDFAWIVNTTTHRRVWTMDYETTEHAGGAEKNRLFDGTLRLEPGSYMVYYKSDGSHSYNHWNDAPPAEPRYWGVSVFPASGRLDRAAIAPYERPGSGAGAIAQLVRIRSGVRARTTFRLDSDQTVRVYAVGEGMSGDMYDYGWIEEAGTGRIVWEMTYRGTMPAGGARKNRLFDGEVRLPAGSYVLRYETDDSHAFGDWNDDPPDDPEAWGIAILRAGGR